MGRFRRKYRASLEQLEDRRLLVAELLISEVVASNLASMEDGYGDTPDWIEVANPSDHIVDLTGYSLSDDRFRPFKWSFPEGVRLLPNDRLIVFASGRNEVDPRGFLHVSFTLDAEGDYLALSDPGGRLLSEFDQDRNTFPPLRPDLAFGILEPDPTGGGAPQYLAETTPGAENGTAYFEGILAPPIVSHDGGIFEQSIEVTIRAPVPGVAIVYTTDASAPSIDHGTYVRPGDRTQVAQVTLTVSSTTVLQATTVLENWLPALPVGRTFLFLDDVIQQDPRAIAPERFPSAWDLNDAGRENGVYSFDSFVVEQANGTGGAFGTTTIVDALRALPTVAITLAHDDLWSTQTGIYVNSEERGSQWRKSGSIEIIFDDLYVTSQIHVGVRGGSRRAKLGLRVDFRDELGASTTQRLGPLSNLTQEPVRSIALRSNAQDSLQQRSSRISNLRDTWARGTLAAMGQVQATSDFVHLYLNGLYWGVYTAVELVRNTFLSRETGSVASALGQDIIVPGSNDPMGIEVVRGDRNAWAELFAAVRKVEFTLEDYLAIQGKGKDGKRDADRIPLLDVPNLIDYVLEHVLAGADDWPGNNFVAARDRSPESSGFRFYAWDQEFQLNDRYNNWVAQFADNVSQAKWTPLELFYELLRADEFRMEVADAIHRNFGPYGRASVDDSIQRWNDIAEAVAPGIVADVARWAGLEVLTPSRDHALPFWTFDDWQQSVEYVATAILPKSYSVAFQRFFEHGWYPTIGPPRLNRIGGDVPPGFKLTLEGDGGTVFVTIDGTDPRSRGGDIAPSAFEFTRPIVLERSTAIKARLRSPTGEWSALEEAIFEVGVEDASNRNLRITELHYRPLHEKASEFIELTNVGSNVIRLDGAWVDGGITFSFDQEQRIRLAPGERLVIVRDLSTFASIYDQTSIFVAGQYSGNLSNGGERLVLHAADDSIIQELDYSDDGDWPSIADGDGPSLQLINLDLDGELGSSWRGSAVDGGTPGKKGYAIGDANLDGFFDSEDLVRVFQANTFEDVIPDNSRWSEGDWTGDGEFTTADLILAFQYGTYETGVFLANDVFDCRSTNPSNAREEPNMRMQTYGPFIVILISSIPVLGETITVDEDLTIGPGNSLPVSTILVRNGNDSPAQVELVTGGRLSTELFGTSEVREESSLFVLGGKFGGDVIVRDTGIFEMNAGQYVVSLDDYPRDPEWAVLRAVDNASLMVSGGVIELPFGSEGTGIQARDETLIRIDGGRIQVHRGNAVRIHDRARLEITSGELVSNESSAIRAGEQSSVYLRNGIVNGGENGAGIWLEGSSQGIVDGGQINNVDGTSVRATADSYASLQNTSLQFNDGDGITGTDNARVRIIDTTIGGTEGSGLLGRGASRFLVVDSEIQVGDAKGVHASEGSRVNLVGTSITSGEGLGIRVDGDAVVDLWRTIVIVEDSSIANHVLGDGILNVRNATVLNADEAGLSFRVSERGKLRVFGTELVIDRKRIQGKFRDGTMIDLTVELQDQGQIELIDLLNADYDVNGTLDQRDIDLLGSAVRSGSLDLKFDLDGSGKVDSQDLSVLVADYLGTNAGDANLDMKFDSSDLIRVLAAGTYETGMAAGWETGDWNQDSLFASSDLVSALQTGNYLGSRGLAAQPVPEPSITVMLLGAIAGLARRERRRSRKLVRGFCMTLVVLVGTDAFATLEFEL